MSDNRLTTLKHQITPEELAGLGKIPRFDDKLDDDDDDEIEVIYKRGDTEISLEKPSRAVYFGDRAVYDTEASIFRQGELSDILSLSEFSRNDQYFGEEQKRYRESFLTRRL
jgi:hypothetical protein